MKYIREKNRIIITDTQDLNVKQTLDCGQIFRFQIDGDVAIVNSLDKQAKLISKENEIEIITDDVEYFERFFDLRTDYSKIKRALRKDAFLSKAVEYGYGIRILNNNVFEMLISFMISANNNIPRIKKSIEFLCTNFGENKGEYFAFPTLQQLKKATIEDFKTSGLGYRAEQMFETVQTLTQEQIDNLQTKTKEEQFNFLLSLKGVGEKVANCILLFGLGRKDVFPVDTWINKVYNDITKTHETNRKKITQELTDRYNNLAGYAQQYFFYYYRDNKYNKTKQ